MAGSSSAARDAGVNAFHAALPIISTRESIRDFIACITHGMVFHVFWNDEGPKLIAATKAALATFSRDREPAPQPATASKRSPAPGSGEGTAHETDPHSSLERTETRYQKINSFRFLGFSTFALKTDLSTSNK